MPLDSLKQLESLLAATRIWTPGTPQQQTARSWDHQTVSISKELRDFLRQYYSEDHLHRLLRALARPPGSTVVRVNTLKTTRESLKSSLLDQLDGSFPVIADPHHEELLVIPVTGPHAAEHIHKEVVVDALCGEAVLRGAHIFAVGIKGCEKGVLPGETVSVVIDIDNKTSKGRTDKFEGPKVFIGNGVALLGRKDLFRQNIRLVDGKAQNARRRKGGRLQGIGVRMDDCVFKSPCLNSICSSDMYLQNLPSFLTVAVLDPQPGEKVMDMCCAPGGKGTHIAQRMKCKGALFLLDRSSGKAAVISRLCRKLLPPNWEKSVFVVARDSTKLVSSPLSSHCFNSPVLPFSSDSDASASSASASVAVSCPPSPPPSSSSSAPSPASAAAAPPSPSVPEQFTLESFDRILLDPPCSGLGLRPRFSALHLSVDQLTKIGYYQRRLVDQAVRLLKPGGTLVYSTCTLNPLENEANVRWALDTFPCLKLVSPPPALARGEVGVGGYLSPTQSSMVQRFDPTSPLDTTGFFIAKLLKTRSCV